MTPGDNAEQEPQFDTKTRKKFERAFGRVEFGTRVSLFTERLIPRVLPSLTIGGAFLTASWLGLWAVMPPLAVAASVIGLGVATLAAPFVVKEKSLFVKKKESLARIDHDIGDPSRPAHTFNDKLAEVSPSEEAQKLWDLHIERMWKKWGGKIKVSRPRPKISARSYLAATAVALSAVFAGVSAGDQKIERLADAFDWHSTQVNAPVAPIPVTAWITPPENISDVEPLRITEETLDHTNGGEALRAHTTSVLTFLLHDRDAKLLINGEEVPVMDVMDQRTLHFEAVLLDEETTISVVKNGRVRLEWHVEVRPDFAPSVEIDSAKTNNEEEKSIEIVCTAQDDHGIENGRIVITAPKEDSAATPLPSVANQALPVPGFRPCSN